MRRQVTGLRSASAEESQRIPDGVFLVRVKHFHFRNSRPKPYYAVNLAVLEPLSFADQVISSRVYCHPKALWKLNWFLRDFGYDTELIDRDEVDERRLIGLQGVIKVSHVICNGSGYIKLDGFAPASQWEMMSPGVLDAPAAETR